MKKDELNSFKKGLICVLGLWQAFFRGRYSTSGRIVSYYVEGDVHKEVLGWISMELNYAYDEMYTKGIVNCSHVGVILSVFCSSGILLTFLLFVTGSMALTLIDATIIMSAELPYVLTMAYGDSFFFQSAGDLPSHLWQNQARGFASCGSFSENNERIVA
ncbi:hypothetical protein HPP92_026936 [Vanilla planifolia]|uniref:Uncharacterized protein n=1 Tax=Vanilla planifolia TaxID=51239 RepID=A0A835U6E8_VANPL|nr:hypothetical protein HPP92_026936 [Vanilla planifolia]